MHHHSVVTEYTTSSTSMEIAQAQSDSSISIWLAGTKVQCELAFLSAKHLQTKSLNIMCNYTSTAQGVDINFSNFLQWKKTTFLLKLLRSCFRKSWTKNVLSSMTRCLLSFQEYFEEMKNTPFIALNLRIQGAGLKHISKVSTLKSYYKHVNLMYWVLQFSKTTILSTLNIGLP